MAGIEASAAGSRNPDADIVDRAATLAHLGLLYKSEARAVPGIAFGRSAIAQTAPFLITAHPAALWVPVTIGQVTRSWPRGALAHVGRQVEQGGTGRPGLIHDIDA